MQWEKSLTRDRRNRLWRNCGKAATGALLLAFCLWVELLVCGYAQAGSNSQNRTSERVSASDSSRRRVSGNTSLRRDPSPVRVTSWTTCPSLDDISHTTASGSILSPCSDSSSHAADRYLTGKCPSGRATALIVDDDAVTRQAGKWEFLQSEIWGVNASVCAGSKESQPLATRLPTYCETIQRLGAASEPKRLVSCEPINRRRAEQDTGKLDRTRTPASRALSRVCTRLLSEPEDPKTWALAVLAFDGVPDAAGSGTPESEFVSTMDSCVARGVNVHVVADPASYSYLYVLAPLQYAQFNEKVAQKLKGQLHDAVPGSSPLVLNVTPFRGYEVGARRNVASLRYERVDLSQGPEGIKSDTFGESKPSSHAVVALNVFG